MHTAPPHPTPTTDVTARQSSDIPDNLRALARRSTWAGILLILLCFAWETWAAPVRSIDAGFNWLALKGLLLAPLLPRFWRGERRAFQILSLLILLYLTEGCMRAYSDITATSRTLAWLEIVLSLYLFYSANRFAYQTRPKPTTQAAHVPKKPRPNGKSQAIMYAYASLLIICIMGWLYPADGTDSLFAQRILLCVYVIFGLFNLILVLTFIRRTRQRLRIAQMRATAIANNTPAKPSPDQHSLEEPTP